MVLLYRVHGIYVTLNAVCTSSYCPSHRGNAYGYDCYFIRNYSKQLVSEGGGAADLDQNNDFFLMRHIRDKKYWRTELKTVRYDKRWRWSALSLL